MARDLAMDYAEMSLRATASLPLFLTDRTLRHVLAASVTLAFLDQLSAFFLKLTRFLHS